jgi:soluble lytic murein transglycosylase-like protein
MQLMPETAQQMGVHNAFDPNDNVRAGTRYFSEV